MKYVKCPRCDLNYIDPENQEYCDVCLAELQGAKLKFADLDDEEEEKTELCPVCGVNYMRFGEKMCDECKKNSEYEADADIDPDKDEEWRNYRDEDADTIEEEPPIDIGEDFDDDFEDDEFEDDEYRGEDEDDDLDLPDGDIDYDEEDEDEDDEDDEDDDF